MSALPGTPAAATPAAVAAAIVVHGIRQSVRWQRGAAAVQSVGRAAAWRRFTGFGTSHSPGLVRWVRGRWAAVQSGGAGGGLAALYRVSTLAFTWLGAVAKGRWAAVQVRWGGRRLGGALPDFVHRILLSLLQYRCRYRVGCWLPVPPEFEVGCQPPRSGGLRKSLAQYG